MSTFDTDCGRQPAQTEAQYQARLERLPPRLRALTQQVAKEWDALPRELQAEFLAVGRNEELKTLCNASQAFTKLCHGSALNEFWKEGIEALRGRSLAGQSLEQVAPGARCWYQAWVRELDIRKLSDFLSDHGWDQSPQQLATEKDLDLSGASLGELPPEIGQLTQLQSADLRWNQLNELPRQIGQLDNLTFLDLSGNGLPDLQEEIGTLAKLQVLNLSANHLRSLPASFANLTDLHSLKLDNNDLHHFPQEITALPELEVFNLEANQIDSIPPSIGELRQLRELNLGFNRLPDLPCELARTQIELLNTLGNPLRAELLVAGEEDEEGEETAKIMRTLRKCMRERERIVQRRRTVMFSKLGVAPPGLQALYEARPVEFPESPEQQETETEEEEDAMDIDE
jgi:hypothetical protein